MSTLDHLPPVHPDVMHRITGYLILAGACAALFYLIVFFSR